MNKHYYFTIMLKKKHANIKYVPPQYCCYITRKQSNEVRLLSRKVAPTVKFMIFQIFHMIQPLVTTLIKEVRKGSLPGCPRIHSKSRGGCAAYLLGGDAAFTQLKALICQDF